MSLSTAVNGSGYNQLYAREKGRDFQDAAMKADFLNARATA
jgi:hypothetical protein